jgi:hypothetical protein
MAEMTELQRCEAKLREAPGTWDWLLNSTDTFIAAYVIAKEYHTRIENVDAWVERGLIPGVIRDPVTGKTRIPRTGLIIFFGRLVMPSFQVA